tara:strand:+ start:110 stop:502 length:393 start_codon:yes stop_codon:yes gene_type:complete
MSVIKTNDLQNTSGGIPTVKGGQRLIPTAWVNFNGTGTVAIRDSENVSSITDNGVGHYTMNFSANMTNADYSVNGWASQLNSTTSAVFCLRGGENNQTVSNADLVVVVNSSSSPSRTDLTVVCASVLGGQ